MVSAGALPTSGAVTGVGSGSTGGNPSVSGVGASLAAGSTSGAGSTAGAISAGPSAALPTLMICMAISDVSGLSASSGGGGLGSGIEGGTLGRSEGLGGGARRLPSAIVEGAGGSLGPGRDEMRGRGGKERGSTGMGSLEAGGIVPSALAGLGATVVAAPPASLASPEGASVREGSRSMDYPEESSDCPQRTGPSPRRRTVPGSRSRTTVEPR